MATVLIRRVLCHCSITYQKADLQYRDYGFILALVCMALAIVVASAIFAPAPVGSGINFSEITTTGL
jgi:hypothetical protein